MTSKKTKEKWLQELNEHHEFPFKYLTDTSVFCKTCEASFSGVKKSQLQQHLNYEKHKKNSALKNKRKQTQLQLEDLCSTSKKSRSEVLGKELCEAFLSANIPWYKLENAKLKSFLEDNLGVTIPGENPAPEVPG